jgi:hypothetical protein
MFGYAGPRRRGGRRTGDRVHRTIGRRRGLGGRKMVEDSGRNRGDLTMVVDFDHSLGGPITVGDFDRNLADRTTERRPDRNLADRTTVGDFDRSRADQTMERGPDRNLVDLTTAEESDLNQVDRAMGQGPDRSLVDLTMAVDSDRNLAGRTMARVLVPIGRTGARDLSRVGLTVGCVRNLDARIVGRDPNRDGQMVVAQGRSLRGLTMVRDRRPRGQVVAARVGRRLPTSRGRLLLIVGRSLPTEVTNVLNRSDPRSPVIRG